jgi:flavin reductase
MLENSNLSSDFRHAMRRFATTVSIVTCSGDWGWHGVTATTVVPVCIEPPTLLVCINQATLFYERLAGSGNFCINL